MGKDELGIILETYADIRHQWIQSNAIKKEDVDKALAKAKSAILAWCLKQLPEEKEVGGRDNVQLMYKPPLRDGDKIDTIYINYDEREGWNACLAEIKRRMGAKEK